MTVNGSSADTLCELKKALRASVLAAREAMSPALRKSASEAVMARIQALDVYREAQTVATYMSFGSELDTHVFFERALADGKRVALPRIDKPAKSLVLHLVGGHHELVEGLWGIREPRHDTPVAEAAEIDMMLVPGVAFDRSGHRLGYGAGYYDKLLASTARKPVRVAAAFDCQVVGEVPAGPHDQPFHLLVTQRQTLHLLP